MVASAHCQRVSCKWHSPQTALCRRHAGADRHEPSPRPRRACRTLPAGRASADRRCPDHRERGGAARAAPEADAVAAHMVRGLRQRSKHRPATARGHDPRRESGNRAQAGRGGPPPRVLLHLFQLPARRGVRAALEPWLTARTADRGAAQRAFRAIAARRQRAFRNRRRRRLRDDVRPGPLPLAARRPSHPLAAGRRLCAQPDVRRLESGIRRLPDVL